ncbi:twin-arginine translocase TatA/TatE family subunit [Coriobacteriia bacterium Es71-Z0120]|uniref:twin-arginine translocase TatA/TatE family subunit n=1 Tax=Parvivirga hydrogeniphila TaxID=2939460 RepID=UPI002260CFFA|nr:twin-arginine translocase TatA/TatE family subunit [Parvivirga hydrogeniphila]MCL4078501.1 twin-arginine translocase TatA/TatE family subunit [Parvivirga hydrogeniphila]
MAAFGLPMGGELWVILIIVLVLFGPSQLPKLAKMFGESAKALKEGLQEGLDEDETKSEPAKSEEKSSEKTE